MARSRIRAATSAAKRAGKFINDVNRATRDGLAMVPYVPQTMAAANLAVAGADAFADMLDAFQGVSHPQIRNGVVAGVSNEVSIRRSAPKFRNSKGVVRVMHKELIGTVNNSATLTTSPVFAGGSSIYNLNARNASAFPWLSQVAQNYDFYKFNRVKLVYVPMCSTATAGRVMLAHDPDSSDAIPLDRIGLSSYACSTEASSWGVCSLDVELPNNQNWYYTTTSAVTGAGALLDQGQVFWATWGGPDSGAVGELYVLYDVSLKDPQPTDTSGNKAWANGAISGGNFGTTIPYFLSTTSTSFTITFYSQGTFLLSCSGASTATGSPGGTAGHSDQIRSDGTGFVYNSVVTVSATGQTVTLTGLTGLGHMTAFVSRITPGAFTWF